MEPRPPGAPAGQPAIAGTRNTRQPKNSGQQTAADASPVGPTMIRAMFEPLGVRPVRLRQDRILDEARHTADPVHLVRVFGISESTAMNYVYAAHPGWQSVIPR